MANTCSFGSSHRRARRSRLERRRALVPGARGEAGGHRPAVRHALVDRAAPLRRRRSRCDLADRAGESPARAPTCAPGRRSSCPSLVDPRSPRARPQSARGPRPRLPRHVRQRTDREPCADRAARAARRRPPALRLRRRNAAAADALDGRAPRSRGDLHHALPRRSLPRAARNAEDVPAAAARRAADHLRPAGAPRPLREPPARVREALVPARAGRGAPGRRARARRLPDPRVPGRTTASPPSATRSTRTTGRAGSTTRPRMRSGSRSGPSGARCSTASRSRSPTAACSRRTRWSAPRGPAGAS